MAIGRSKAVPRLKAVLQIKVLLFFVAVCTAVAAVAHKFDVVDQFAALTTATPSLDPAPRADPRNAALQGRELAALTPAAGVPSATPATPATSSPSFDIVRVERDGSVLVAGKASPNARVEVVNGTFVIGKTMAGSDGDFVVVVDELLKPGAHQLKLRSTAPDDAVTESQQVALVAIPETKDAQLLVLIEQPGEPSKLVTVPEAVSSNSPPIATGQVNAAASLPADLLPGAPIGKPKVAVEAVEIDGRKIFLAGVADPGRKVRAYINDVPLGDTVTSSNGRFLIEADRDVAVGDYIIHVEILEPDSTKVIAQAAVPFQRQAGMDVAAVAQAAPNVPASAPALKDATAETKVAVASGELAPKLRNVESAVIIRRGDTLWQISHRVYGHGVRYSTIYLANESKISDPDRIWPGQVFSVPERTPEGEAANMKAVGEQATSTSVE
jgi:nucleoid-associated protein YgaU